MLLFALSKALTDCWLEMQKSDLSGGYPRAAGLQEIENVNQKERATKTPSSPPITTQIERVARFRPCELHSNGFTKRENKLVRREIKRY